MESVSSIFEQLLESYNDEMESPGQRHSVSIGLPTSQMQQRCCILVAVCKATVVLPSNTENGIYLVATAGDSGQSRCDYMDGAGVNN